jgi:hypothetical protein
MSARPSPVALVTGGASGMGAAVFQRLSSDGHRVVVADLDEAAAAQVAADLPGEAVAVGGDVADETGVAGHLEAALDAFGRLDRVVLNAGVPGLSRRSRKSLSRRLTGSSRSTCAASFSGCARRPGPAWTSRRGRRTRRVPAQRRRWVDHGGSDPDRRGNAGRRPVPSRTGRRGMTLSPIAVRELATRLGVAPRTVTTKPGRHSPPRGFRTSRFRGRRLHSCPTWRPCPSPRQHRATGRRPPASGRLRARAGRAPGARRPRCRPPH